MHSSPVGGHSGVPATVKRLQSLFAWPGLRNQVQEFVKSCPTCQQAKPERVKYPGLLQPLQTPSEAWQVISIDFVEGLPHSHAYNCILVVVDLFSKYSHFVAMKHPFTALSVTKIFMTKSTGYMNSQQLLFQTVTAFLQASCGVSYSVWQGLNCA